MATDWALLQTAARSVTLRVYRWDPVAVSLGRFQRGALPASLGHLPVVRRITGGGALVHDELLTYAVVGPLSQLGCSLSAACTVIHSAICTALTSLGLSAEIVCQQGRSSSQSIHGITQTGEIIGATFSGEVSYRNQLAKENRDETFFS